MPTITGRPPYRRIADDLREQISSGQLRPGMQVPSDRVLGRRHGVSRTTARAALRILREEGLVAPKRGSGTYVAEEPGNASSAPRYTASTITDSALDQLYLELTRLRHQVHTLSRETA